MQSEHDKAAAMERQRLAPEADSRPEPEPEERRCLFCGALMRYTEDRGWLCPVAEKEI